MAVAAEGLVTVAPLPRGAEKGRGVEYTDPDSIWCSGGGGEGPRRRIHGPVQHLVLGVRARDPAARDAVPGCGGDRREDGRAVRGLRARSGAVGSDVRREVAGLRPRVHERGRGPASDADGSFEDGRVDRRLPLDVARVRGGEGGGGPGDSCGAALSPQAAGGGPLRGAEGKPPPGPTRRRV